MPKPVRFQIPPELAKFKEGSWWLWPIRPGKFRCVLCVGFIRKYPTSKDFKLGFFWKADDGTLKIVDTPILSNLIPVPGDEAEFDWAQNNGLDSIADHRPFLSLAEFFPHRQALIAEKGSEVSLYFTAVNLDPDGVWIPHPHDRNTANGLRFVCWSDLYTDYEFFMHTQQVIGVIGSR